MHPNRRDVMFVFAACAALGGCAIPAELLNETNRDEVTAGVLRWLGQSV